MFVVDPFALTVQANLLNLKMFSNANVIFCAQTIDAAEVMGVCINLVCTTLLGHPRRLIESSVCINLR